MKTILILILSLFIGNVVATAQTSNEKTAKISFKKTTHDYGTIKYKEEKEGIYSFKFTNIGKKALILTQVKASCGCTTPSWSRKPVMPGKTGVIIVKYDTKRIGAFNKSITIYSNDPDSPTRLHIKGTVLPTKDDSQNNRTEIEIKK